MAVLLPEDNVPFVMLQKKKKKSTDGFHNDG